MTNPQTVKGQEIKGQEMTNAQRIIPKLIIVSPCSCYCPGSFTDVDENIVFDGHIPYKATRAGNIDRDYKSSVYKVTDPDTNEVRGSVRNDEQTNCFACCKISSTYPKDFVYLTRDFVTLPRWLHH